MINIIRLDTGDYWVSTLVTRANSHLVCDPTIWQPGFDLPRQQWSLLHSADEDIVSWLTSYGS